MPDDTAKTDVFDEVGFMMAWESDALSEERVIEGFQHLINSGMIHSLQGAYERMAARLQQAGLVHGFQ